MFSKPRKSRRLLATASAGVAIVLALSACSTAPAATQSTAAGPTTINFWSWNPDAGTSKPYIDAFEASHPNIKVKMRFIQYSDYVNTTQLALQSGSGPDVFGLQVGALTNQFAPLAEDLTPAISKQLGDDWKTKLTATDQLAVDGKQVALPWMITGGGLVWANQTLVDSLKLTVPTTYEELKSFCAEVKKAKKYCIVQGAKDSWQNIDVYQAIINQVSPGTFYTAMAGKADFSSPEFVKAFEIWKSFFSDGIFQEGALGATAYPDANDAFHKGQAALMINGTWQNADTTKTRLAQYTKTYGASFENNTAFMPYFFPKVADGGATGTLFGGPDVGFAVSSASKAKDAAETFVTWLTANAEGQKIMAKTVQQPALSSVSLDLSDVTTPQQVTALQAQGPALKGMIGQREIQNADVKTALGDALSAVASGQQSPAQAAASVQKAIAAAK